MPSVKRVRARRIIRKLPGAAWREFQEPVFNRGQLLTLIGSIIGTALIIQTGPRSVIAEQAGAWSAGILAFCYVTVVWAVISVARAPFIVIRDDRASGTWHGNRFVYHEPRLVATFRCRATGDIERYKFVFSDVEPDAFVDFSVTLDPDVSSRASYTVNGTLFFGSMEIGSMKGRGGTRLPANRQGVFSIKMLEATRSTTARVYCHSFSIGNPEDNDGQTGTFQFPFRPPISGDGST